jgi:hypothetical protein
MKAPPRATAASAGSTWRAQAAAVVLALASGCGGPEAVSCPAPGGFDPASTSPDDACLPAPQGASPSSGRFTRVAALDAAHLVAVSQTGVPGAVRVVVVGARGPAARPDDHAAEGPQEAGLVTEVELLPPMLSGGARATSAGVFPAVAARDGRVHVAWHDPAGGRLLHAEARFVTGLDSAPLLAFGSPEVVAGGPVEVAGTQLALALDEAGGVHLVFREEGGPPGAAQRRPALRYATRGATDGARWAVEGVDGSEDAAYPALVLVPGPDGLPSPRVAFQDVREGDLELAARVEAGEGAWRVTTLDGRDPTTGRDTGDVGAHVAMALTPGRSLALVYQDATAGTLRALTPGEPPRVLDDGRWLSADGRVLTRTVGQFARLAITSDGVWHVVHLEADGPRWRYLRLSGERVAVATELDGLAPGGWLDLTPLGSGLAGAYGAFREAGALGTTLRWFFVPGVEGTP